MFGNKIKGGYVPGERVKFSVQIENKTSERIDPILVEFLETISLGDISLDYERPNQSHVRSRVKVTSQKPIEPMEIFSWNDDTSSLVLPTKLIVSNGRCDLIEIKHELKLSFSPTSIEISIPIIIGNGFFCISNSKFYSFSFFYKITKKNQGSIPLRMNNNN